MNGTTFLSLESARTENNISSLVDVCLSYLPPHIAENILAHPNSDPRQLPQRFEAVALFADVSGFTAIGERLGKTGKAGKAGSEELTVMLNSYFEPMINLVSSYGGSIGKFGGDAITVIFPVSANPADTIISALECALQMQARMGAYAQLETSVGTFNLAMKAGLAYGTLLNLTVGDPATRLEYVIAGSVLDKCAEAEHHAANGETVVDRQLLQIWATSTGKPIAELVEIAEIGEKGEDFNFCKITRLYQATSVVATPLTLPILPIPPSLPDLLPVLSAYLHPALLDRLEQRQSGFLNEHRKVSVLFVGFDNLDYDNDPSAAQKLQTAMAQVISIVQNYDGYLNKIDMGDKGSKYIILFGTPVSHEDNEERALNCALELMQVSGNTLRIGLNSGYVYCGLVGSATRQEYTVMGDAVNLAARLMQAARRGQILVSKYVHRSIEISRFRWEELEPIRVKGKTHPVTVFGLLGKAQSRNMLLAEHHITYSLPMVGRATELELMRQKLASALSGHGQIIGLCAEAGMGKSRLLSEFIHHALQTGITGYSGECYSYGTNVPYHAWYSVWQAFFGVDPDQPTDQQLAQLETSLAEIVTALVPRAPLLGNVLHLSFPDNPLTRPMEPKLRKASLEALLVECVRHRARRNPLLLILEDCHWLDPLSTDLLEAIARNIGDLPVLIVLLYRPPEPDQPSDIERLAQFSYFSEIRLHEFSFDETRELVFLKLAQLWGTANVEIPPELLTRISDRAQGNPFYIDELINLIRDRELNPVDVSTLSDFDLPDSLNSLILSRIDRLHETEKLTLKVASVIGRLFRAGWIWGSSPDVGSPTEIRANLSELSRLELTPLEKSEPELEYFFKHVITREVTYESLALATRVRLHEQVGLYIERTYASQLDRYLDILAFHFGQTHNLAKQREYFARAGRAAQDAYANAAAISYYRRLLPLLEPAAQGEIMLRLGQILELISEWEAAGELYRQTLEVADQSSQPLIVAEAQLATGKLYTRQKRWADAVPWLEQARATFETVQFGAGLCQTLTELGEASRLQGDFAAAEDFYRQSLDLAHNLQPESLRLEIEAGVFRALGILAARRGQTGEAANYFEQGLQIMQKLGNKPGIASLLNNLAITATMQNEFKTARPYFEQSLLLYNELGDRWGAGQSLNNLGMLAQYEGNNMGAFLYLGQSLENQRQLGDSWGIANTLCSLGDVAISLGDLPVARRYLTESLELQSKLGEKVSLAYLLEYFAGLNAAEGDASTALRLAGCAATLRENIGAKLSPSETSALSERLAPAFGGLPDAQQVALLEAGRKLSLEEAVKLALGGK
jgi:adenylate cyclase